ncbi:hypothetical protein NDU88_002175 [Pleurodeles waltl]|uniref:Reverse transcriptase domain-containing protein n=1 Tax=Pleurodeles waltl TaxID=8319 RepID=A0AAV7V9T2_PLEWA|nr:hypothetical protein NDU88_002175 [Pleurodeles waltl]
MPFDKTTELLITLDVESLYTNIPQEATLKCLTSDPTIVIKWANKGGATVILPQKMYKDECLRLLGNTQHYKRLSRDPTPEIQEEIAFLVSRGSENNWLTKEEAAFLIQTNPKVPYFYILTKVHKGKIPPPGRPIVSGIGSVLEPLSQFCDFLLQPLVKQFLTYLKDTTDILVLLETMPFDKTTELLITLDVESLYTNIPQEATLDVICDQLERTRGGSRTPPEFILDLAHLALTRNFFELEKTFYLQIHGTSMGSTFAPSLACLYVDSLHYINDILLIWSGTKREAQAFAYCLNTSNPCLKFTMTKGNNQLPFLDLLIHEKN